MRSDTIPTPHLPTELLSQILENVDGDANTLHNVSLTCRHFRSLAQALIFRSVHLTCDDENDLSRQIARLDFYSSDAIAPFVRELCMTGFMVEEYTTLVAKIFDVLPRFLNIRSLSCVDVNFTQFALHQVSTLSSLEDLIAMNCSVTPETDSLLMLRPRTFAYLADSPEDRLGADHWLTLLDPDHLQVLNIPLTEDSCSFFLSNDNPSFCPFPSLRGVELDVDEESLPMLPMVLSKTPMLRSLKLCPLYSNIVQSNRIVEGIVSPVPYLEEYGGPHNLLPIILGRATGCPSAHLRRLFLVSVGKAGDPLDAFMNSCKSCHPLQLRALTHLHISLLESMDLKSLAKLQDMFPVLQEFYLHASEKYRPSGLLCQFSRFIVHLTELAAFFLDRTGT
jgi:hypothetical protein